LSKEKIVKSLITKNSYQVISEIAFKEVLLKEKIKVNQIKSKWLNYINKGVTRYIRI